LIVWFMSFAFCLSSLLWMSDADVQELQQVNLLMQQKDTCHIF